MAHKRIANAVLFFVMGLPLRLSPPFHSFAPAAPTANNGVDGSIQDKSQALDGPLADNGSYPLFLFGRALTVPTYRTPQGVTVPRCLRLTAVGTIETSPYGSAFTYGYLLRSISLHRLRRQQTTESMGLYQTNLKP